MYRQNAAPSPPDPLEAGRQATKTCGHLQIGVAVMHVVTFTVLTLQFSVYKPPAQLQVPEALVHEWRLTALLAGIAYVAIFAAWGTLNAWGLKRRSKVARWSSVAFGAATIATCCGWPFGGFLLYMLLRRDVKSYFDASDAAVNAPSGTPPVV